MSVKARINNASGVSCLVGKDMVEPDQWSDEVVLVADAPLVCHTEADAMDALTGAIVAKVENDTDDAILVTGGKGISINLRPGEAAHVTGAFNSRRKPTTCDLELTYTVIKEALAIQMGLIEAA